MDRLPFIMTFLFSILFFQVYGQISFNYDFSGNRLSQNIQGNISQVQIQGPLQACKNENLSLTASGGNSYLWSTGAITASIQINAQSSQTYIVTVTSNGNCETVVEHPLEVFEESAALSVAGENRPLGTANAPSYSYSVPQQSSANYNWQVEGGNIISGAGTEQVQVAWTDDYEGSISITESNDQNCTLGQGSLAVQIKKQQDIPVESGWNLVSFYLQPPNTAMEYTMQSIDPVLEQVKDEFGIYFHNQNPIFNSLQAVSDGQGYWVRTNQNGTITQQGLALKPETVAIPLQAAPAWNLIGYPCPATQDVETALASILSNVVQVKNIDEFYDPSFPPIFNSLSEMKPGSGYWIKVDAPVTLYFPRPDESNLLSATSRNKPILPDNWKRVAYPNSMSAVGWVTLDGVAVQEEDAIGVFVDGECRAVNWVKNAKDSSFVSMVINGVSADSLVFQLYKNGDIYTSTFYTNLQAGAFLDYQMPLTFYSGTTSNQELLKKELSFSASPNPVNSALTMEFTLPAKGLVTLKLIDTKGSVLRTFVNTQLQLGKHQYFWNSADFSSGTYLIQLTTSKGIITEKIIVTK